MCRSLLLVASLGLSLSLVVAAHGQQTKPTPKPIPSARASAPQATADKDPFTDPATLPGSSQRWQIDPKVYRWSAGEPAVKMIHSREGICFLTSVEGQFTGPTGGVRVFLGKDGFWYLTGQSPDKDSKVAASAMALRFLVEAPAAPPTPAIESSKKPAASGLPLPVGKNAEKKVEIKLPAPMQRWVVGGGGKYLICYLESLGQLAIVDVESASIAKYLAVGEGARFAAGRSHLVIVRSPQEIVQRFKLGGEFERELSIPSPVDGLIADIVIGADSEGPVLARYPGDRFDREPGFALLDLKTLKKMDGEAAGDLGGRFENVRIWASADGQTFGMMETGVSPSGLTTIKLQGKRLSMRHEHESVGHVMPSADGRFFFTAAGLYNADLQPLDNAPRRARYYPTHHPAFFLGVNEVARSGGDRSHEETNPLVTVYSLGDRRKLFSLPPMPELTDSDHDTREIDRLQLFPTQKRLVTLTPQRDRLVIRQLDMIEAMQRADIDFLFVASLPPRTATRGATYSYPIKVESRRGHVKFELDSGPDAMQVSADGVVTWAVPRDLADRQTSVILRISDASEQEIFHTFVIQLPDK
jgi:hypothetical protein